MNTLKLCALYAIGGLIVGYLLGLNDGSSSCPSEKVLINGNPVPISEANSILEKNGSAFRFPVEAPE